MGNSKDSIRLPRVALIADSNALILSLAQELIKSQCSVAVITDKPSYWKEKHGIRKTGEQIEFLKDKSKKVDQKYNYIIFLNLHQGENKRKIEKKLNLAIELARSNSAKALFIFPYVQRQEFKRQTTVFTEKILGEKEFSVGILYIGQLLNYNLGSLKDDFSRVFEKIRTQKKVLLPKAHKDLYPVSARKVSRKVVRLLLSFGAFGKKTAVISNPVSAGDFFKLLKTEDPELRVEYTNLDWGTPGEGVREKILVKQNLKEEIRKVIGTLGKKKVSLAAKRFEKFKQKKIAKKRKSVKLPRSRVFRSALLFVGVATLPFLFILMSASGLIFAREQALSGNIAISRGALSFSKTTSMVIEVPLRALSETALFSGLVRPFLSISSFLVKASSLGIDGVSLIEDSSDFLTKISGEEVYRTSYYTERLALNLDYFYKEAGFLQGELELLSGVGGELVKKVIGKSSLKRIRNRAFGVKNLVIELAELLGEGRQRTYLVLFQNNLELRPTGGYIDAYALVTFNQGRMIDMSTHSVYTADEKLAGYVEPPEPMTSYLNKESWKLADSNWDPDFPTAAQRAEWFLDKEVDQQVNGVIAIDLEFVKRVLDETLPIRISTVGRQVSGKDLYSLVLKELTKDTTSDSQMKADFFAELLGEVLLSLTKLTEKEKLTIGGVLAEALETRHVQIFLHNRKAQRAISELGWDGAVQAHQCSGNCIFDWVGIVESNFSERPNSFFIKRRAELNVTFEEGVVKKRLLITISNNFPKNEDPGSYSSYIRVLVPSKYGFSPILISSKEGESKVTAEVTNVRGHREAGVFIELAPHEEKSLLFSWEGPVELDFERPGEYRFSWRKQAGTYADPVKLSISFPKGVSFSSYEEAFLTDESVFGYNTELSRDIVSRISW